MGMAKKDLTQSDKLALAEYAAPLSLWAFCCYWDYEFFAVRRPFLKQVADAYQLAYDCWAVSMPTRTAVSMPPRSGKSYLTTLGCAWILGRASWASLMRCTGTAQLFAKFSRDCRAIVSDARYRRIFPEVRLNPSNRGVMQWSLRTSKQTAYFGNGVGGSIIGFGANFGILDDLYPDMLRALSTTYTERVNTWLDSAFTSRLEKGAPVIYCGTRWTDTDMIGRALQEGLDAYLRIPALDADGETFCADVKTTAEYRALRKSLRLDDTHDGYVWMAEYMQDPQRIDGYLYPADALAFYDTYPDSVTLLESCCFIDPADTGEDGFTAVWADIVSDGGEVAVYVRDVLSSGGDGVEACSARVADRCDCLRTQTCLVEGNGVGRAAYILIRNAVKDTAVRAYMEHTPKEVRILSTFEHVRRTFRFPRPRVDNAMYYRFFDQLRGTPAKKLAEYRHRLDPADTLAQASNYVKKRYGYAA